jgi:hypothetical protein
MDQFDQLVENRRLFVDSTKKNNFGAGIKNLLTNLYPDNAHFVYELLQNAEDAHASFVKFTLSKDKLRFDHNGQRQFEIRDVESITSIGNSTKAEDVTKIGKFGVGFKAVFAYTAAPEIYTNAFNFNITELVLPTLIQPLEDRTEDCTTFIFQFNSTTKSAEKASSEVKNGLQNLGLISLLFLRNIKEIICEFSGSDERFSIRRDSEPQSNNGAVAKIQKSDGFEIKEKASWLVYSKNVEIKDPEDGKLKECVISIAFELEEAPGEKKIKECKSGNVSIFFPAAKETSNLRFHLNAPFASTVARDSVRSCEANDLLRDEIAKLMADSLPDIRDRGLLSISALAVLPNNNDPLSGFYKPIREAIFSAFREKDLVPTMSGIHRKATELYRAQRSVISRVINDKDLAHLLSSGHQHLWAQNPTQLNQREDVFLQNLNISVWGWLSLKQAIESNSTRIAQLVTIKDDTWLRSFYALLHDCHNNLVSYGNPRPLDRWKNLSGVRVSKRDYLGHQHEKPKGSYFYSDQMPDSLWHVKIEIVSENPSDQTEIKARDFLSLYGVRHYDEKADLELRLSEYPGRGMHQENHLRDLRDFIDFLIRNPKEHEIFYGKPFLRVEGLSNAVLFSDPENVYVDASWYQTGFTACTEIHGRKRLMADYVDLEDTEEASGKMIDFLRRIGVFCDFTVNEASARLENNCLLDNVKQTGWNKNYTIDNLEAYLKKENHFVNKLIWRALISADKLCGRFQYRRSSHDYTPQSGPSTLVRILKSSKWVPCIDGKLRVPSEVSEELLPSDLIINKGNGLLDAIDFAGSKKVELIQKANREIQAAAVGFNSAKDLDEALELLRKHKAGLLVERKEKATQGSTGAPLSPSAEISDEPKQGHLESGNIQLAGVSPTPSLGGSVGENIQKIVSMIDVNKPSFRCPVEGQSGLNLRGTPHHPAIEGGLDDSPDDDVLAPVPIDYAKKIQTAERRYASEIADLERSRILMNEADRFEKYTYGWFLALLELECLASVERNSDGKEISIRFGKVTRKDDATISLSQPDRYVPQAIEEYSNVRLDLRTATGIKSIQVASFSAKEFELLGRLDADSNLADLKLEQVLDSWISIQNPSFLLDAVFQRFLELGEKLKIQNMADFSLKENLTKNINFVFGPPGTGKTTHLANEIIIPRVSREERVKILVLTPTNKAADVLVERIMTAMGENNSFVKWIVRFGSSSENIAAKGILKDRNFDISACPRCVVVTTIARFAYDGFSGSPLKDLRWDLVIFDEASMIPIANIIYPLYQCDDANFVIAGDPFQIEPIVSVNSWKEENIYKLVELRDFREQTTTVHGYKVKPLATQYRSVPAIGKIFSEFLYKGCLNHHRKDQDRLNLDAVNVLKPLTIINFTVSKHESIYRSKRLKSGTSYHTYSAIFTFEFVRWLRGEIGKAHKSRKVQIGVVAPYRAQADIVSKLVDSLGQSDSRCHGSENIEVHVGSVHGFQGDECDIIVAVLNPPPRISDCNQMFLNKKNILNVAISRARDYLVLVMPDETTDGYGNLRPLRQIKELCKKDRENFTEIPARSIEEIIFENSNFLEENVFSTGHQMVNVYRRPSSRYEVRSDNFSVDVQIHAEAGIADTP